MRSADAATAAIGAGSSVLLAGSAAAPASLPRPQLTGYQIVSALLAPSFVVQRANRTWAATPAYMQPLPKVASHANFNPPVS